MQPVTGGVARAAWRHVIILSGAIALAAAHSADAGSRTTQSRPNFLVIVADDLGYSDLGVMGSEIRTPNLDRLAADGLLLTAFHVTPTCSPTRAMLLTGVDTHPAGLGTMHGQWSPEQQGKPGYEGVLSDRVVTVATLLRDAGYHTYLSGKWHLGGQPGQYPTDRGFERSFGPISGGATHFSDLLPLFFPGRDTAKALFIEDGEPVVQLPERWFSTNGFTDKLIEQIESGRADGRPFLALATYTAPHWPLQAPDDFIDRYKGVYDDGWDALRERRMAALKRRGLVSAYTSAPARVPWAPAWADLDEATRAQQARVMEVYAAMVENLDHNVGRLLEYLAITGQLDNTLVLFFSDNGAEGNPVNRIIDDHGWVERTFDNRLENIGRVGSYVSTAPGWAQASSAPFRLFKSFPTQGGLQVPAIAHGPGVAGQRRSAAFVTVKDLAPTLLEMAGVEVPNGRYGGREVARIEGRSMTGLLAGRQARVHGDGDVMGWELFGRRALRRGDWKITWLYEPYGPGRWELFNLADDPAESRDLAAERPDMLGAMLAAWHAYAEGNGVILPESDAGYALEDDWR